MIIAPVPTPFDAQGRPDWGALAELIQILEPHVDGILLYGSNGEAVHLTLDERRQGLASLHTTRPCWIGCGDESLPQALTHVRDASSAGAHAVLVTPPRYYTSSLGADDLRRYYRGLADDSDCPVWLYHVPQLTRTELPTDVVAELSKHPLITGIKDSSGELGRIAAYEAAGLDLTVFTGHAPTLLGALALGAQGAILAAANLAPGAYRALFSAWKRRDYDEARRRQSQLEPLGRILGQGGFVLLKQAMRYLGLPAGFPRSPYPSESRLWPKLESVLVRLQDTGDLIM